MLLRSKCGQGFPLALRGAKQKKMLIECTNVNAILRLSRMRAKHAELVSSKLAHMLVARYVLSFESRFQQNPQNLSHVRAKKTPTRGTD